MSNIITSVNTSVPIKGTGMSLGIATGSTTSGYAYGGLRVGDGNQSGVLLAPNGNYGKNVGTASSGISPASGAVAGITTDATKSGIVGTVTRTSIACYYVIKY